MAATLNSTTNNKNNQVNKEELNRDLNSKNATMLKNIRNFFSRKTTKTAVKGSYNEFFKLEYGLKESLLDPNSIKKSSERSVLSSRSSTRSSSNHRKSSSRTVTTQSIQ